MFCEGVVRRNGLLLRLSAGVGGARVIIYWLEVVNDVLGAVECRFPNDFNVLNLHLDEICLGYLR